MDNEPAAVNVHTVITSASPADQPRREPPSLAEQFRQELYAGLLGRCNAADRKWFTEELASKVKYKRLEWAARDLAIEEVTRKLAAFPMTKDGLQGESADR